MYKYNRTNRSGLSRKNTSEGETIEMKVRRIIDNKEPISDGAPLLYNSKDQGVNPATNIRTDRWEIAVVATDMISKESIAKGSEVTIEGNKKTEGTESSEE